MDTMDGTDVGPATTSTGGGFVRQSDSHTLWGRSSEEDIRKVDIGGNFINDLYMAATQQVIAQVDPDFEVLVNPFEGGSDHEAFLEKGVPAALTWHFTDYVYHTAKDTLFFSSARELEEEYGKDTAAELADEKAVLTAWEDWYQEALASCGNILTEPLTGTLPFWRSIRARWRTSPAGPWAMPTSASAWRMTWMCPLRR